ncbi:ASPIC/UnbV domain-containing protein, partial [Saprospiraceae bacterium]|nr:ASPIC/UnbV domain-containing protein [Saprospiraceae bacterium]
KVASGSSFGANSLQLEIGLGEAEKIESCRIIWPFAGSVSDYKDIAINKFYILTEENDEAEERVYGL